MRKIIFIVTVFILSGIYSTAQQRLVLYEAFSGENCNPCAAANPGLWSLVSSNPSKILMIKYQSPIPSAGPIYEQNKRDPDNRLAYYSINSAPSGKIDGITVNDGTPTTFTQTELDAAAAIPSSFKLTVSHIYNVTGDSININVSINSIRPFTGKKMKLRAALVETLHFSTPPGTNGETDFHNVVRRMYPGPDGMDISNSWTTNTTENITLSGIAPHFVNKSSGIFVVVWLQDDETKVIAQTARSQPIPLPLDASLKITSPRTGELFCGASNTSHTVELRNVGSTHISSATIYSRVDNGAWSTHSWTGNLPFNGAANIDLGALNIGKGANQIMDSIGLINGKPDINSFNSVEYFNIAAITNSETLPIIEDFESSDDIPKGWMVLDHRLHVIPSTGSTGSDWFLGTASEIGPDKSDNVFAAPNFNGAMGNNSYLVLPFINLPGGLPKALDFYYSYAQRDNFVDRLEIVYSTNCGKTWNSVWGREGADLATAPATKDEYFIPSSPDDWKFVSVNLKEAHGDALVGFKAVSGTGNYIYVDKIELRTGASTSVEDLENSTSITIYPNPVSKYLNLNLNFAKESEVTLSILNLTGQQVLPVHSTVLSSGQLNIDVSSLAPGMYFVNVYTDKSMVQGKFIKQ